MITDKNTAGESNIRVHLNAKEWVTFGKTEEEYYSFERDILELAD